MAATSLVRQKMGKFKGMVEARRAEIGKALPAHLTPDRMIRVALTAMIRSPKLLDCSQASVMEAIMESSQLGLLPDGVTGEAYMIPYGQKCTLIPGYRGLMQMARRSGEVSTIAARVVREKDHFRYCYGLHETVEHKPFQGEGDLGVPTHVYCVVRLKDGGVQFDVMTVAEVEEIRKRSRSAQSGPWVTDWEAMARKTVIRRTLKMCPFATEAGQQLQAVISADEQREAGLEVRLDVEAEDLGAEEEPGTGAGEATEGEAQGHQGDEEATPRTGSSE